MANEFVLKNGLKVTGSANIQTSLVVPTLTVSGTGSFGNVTIAGNLDVQGNINAVNETNLNVTDKIISVAAGATSTSQADGAGLFISGANASVTWDNGNSRLAVSNDTNVNGTLSATSLSGNGASITSLDAGNISTGTISDDRLPGTITSDITGNAATATSSSYANNASTADLADDSTLLDGQAASYYTNASNISTGTIDDARLPGTITSDITGNAATATLAQTASYVIGGAITGSVENAVSSSYANNASTADLADDSTLLDGQAASYYTNASNINAGTIGDAYLPGTITSDITGNAATATTSSYVAGANVDGQVSSAAVAASTVASATAGDGISSFTFDGSTAATVGVDSTVIRTSGTQTIAGVKTFTDKIVINTNSAQSSTIDKTQSTSVTSTISSVQEISATGTDAVFFDYVVKNSTTDLRAGTMMVVTNGSTVAYTEFSTTDIGDTSAITLSADISGGNIRFRAVASTGTWTVRSLARTI